MAANAFSNSAARIATTSPELLLFRACSLAGRVEQSRSGTPDTGFAHTATIQKLAISRSWTRSRAANVVWRHCLTAVPLYVALNPRRSPESCSGVAVALRPVACSHLRCSRELSALPELWVQSLGVLDCSRAALVRPSKRTSVRASRNDDKAPCTP